MRTAVCYSADSIGVSNCSQLASGEGLKISANTDISLI